MEPLFVAGKISPGKKIAYFFIQNCFKCDYDHYSTVACGNWRKNVLCLQIRCLIAVANLGLRSYSSFQGVVLWSDLYTALVSLTNAAMCMSLMNESCSR